MTPLFASLVPAGRYSDEKVVQSEKRRIIAVCHVISATEKGFAVKSVLPDGGADTGVVAGDARTLIVARNRRGVEQKC